MASRRPLGLHFPPWTAPDPFEALSIHTKLGLGLVAGLFDSITDTLIEDHVMLLGEQLEAKSYSPRGGGRGLPYGGSNITKEKAKLKEQLKASYPRLETHTEMGKLILHTADKLSYDYWLQRCRCSSSSDMPSRNTAQVIVSLREEAIVTYETIRTELEKKDIRVLLDLSNTIRLKLVVLEPVLGYWGHRFQVLKVRERMEARSSSIEDVSMTNIAPAVIAITTIVTFGTLLPLGFAWSHAQDAAGTSADMDFWFLIQNSIMQVLGIFMATYPISKTKKLSRTPWYWALFFTALGVVCSIGSIPMYLYMPVFWSGFVSFVGTVAQVSMSVQLVLLAMSNSRLVKQD